MDSEYKIYMSRAQNELNLSIMIMKISEDENLQRDVFGMPSDTYFSAVITHSYYCIFYSAKAYLLSKGIKTGAPEEHRKTYDEMKKLVEKGIIDVELLRIYEGMMVRADTLLKIFEVEKGKRGKFTYRTLPQANREPAQQSVKHSGMFFKHIHSLLEGK